MKNIFKVLFTILISGAFFISCVDEESNYDALMNEPDANAAFYVQFLDAAQSLETGVTEAGDLVDIETTVAVSLMGMPQSQDIAVNWTVDPSSTIGASMYSMSASSITIPAGATSGSVNFNTITENMPVGETLKLVLNLDAGDNNSPNSNGTKLSYDLKRIEFCPLENGAADLVGTWKGTDAVTIYTDGASQVVTAMEGGKLMVTGMGIDWMNNFWGESVIAGGTVEIVVNGNGTVEIPEQYYITTVYDGAEQDPYTIRGSGKWTNCGAYPTMTIEYEMNNYGTDWGAWTFANGYSSDPIFIATLTLDPAGLKSAVVLKSQEDTETNCPEAIRSYKASR